MKNRTGTKLRKALAILSILSWATELTPSQQVADPNFDAKVANPAFTKKHPRVLFDEGHNNFHTSTGRYKPFADLMTNDGYTVIANKDKFSRKTLEDYDILVIANALGAEAADNPKAGESAFTDEECDAVKEWVNSGGSLLLIADHAPFGSAASKLADRFAVNMSKGYTSDPNHRDEIMKNPTFIEFSRQNGLLSDNAITRGRNPSEKINRIITFTGQSLKGPEGSAFLVLSNTAVDQEVAQATSRPATPANTVTQLPNGITLPPGARVQVMQGPATGQGKTAAGRSQAAAFEVGKGRVVILAEAAMLSAQVVKGPMAQLLGKEELPMGMSRKDIDNRQLALNIMHWLSRIL